MNKEQGEEGTEQLLSLAPSPRGKISLFPTVHRLASLVSYRFALFWHLPSSLSFFPFGLPVLRRSHQRYPPFSPCSSPAHQQLSTIIIMILATYTRTHPSPSRTRLSSAGITYTRTPDGYAVCHGLGVVSVFYAPSNTPCLHAPCLVTL